MAEPVPFHAAEWLNADTPLSLADFKDRVLAVEVFQMLCPGCVSHGLPQAQKLRKIFPEEHLVVLGLHTVFEHHAVMSVEALRAFVHEYRWSFPIGIDQAAPDGDLPLTMQAYGFRGTPSLALIDRQGELRFDHLGRIDDLVLGGMLGRLLAEGTGG